MTRAKIQCGAGHYCIICEGHSADTACCNYITGVLYAFGGYVKSREAAGKCKVERFEIDEKLPRFVICCGGDDRIEAAFLAACIGLKQLETTRPDAISVQVEEK